MAFLKLPPETLTEIFDHVGSSFFHEDLGRLAVCKHWLEFARPACFKCITLSLRNLPMLVSPGNTTGLSSLKESLQSLDLGLTGYRGLVPARHAQEYPQEPHVVEDPALNDGLINIQLETWGKVLGRDLAELAVIAQQCRKLRILRMRAYHSPLHTQHDYLSLSTIQTLLSVQTLSVLVLDLPVGIIGAPGERWDKCHLCPAISALLPTLRTLHLRMYSICPDALTPRDPNQSLRLSEIVVNLSRFENLPGITGASHSTRCSAGPPSGGLPRLKADLCERTEALAARMASPKVVRILTHSLQALEIQSLDVLTGKTMMLGEGAAWNEDGEVVEDSEPESEIEDDGFSDFSDE